MLDSSYKVYKGHSKLVSSVRFSYDGEHLISIGAIDKTICQWRVIKDKPSELPKDDLFIDPPLKMDIRMEQPDEDKQKENIEVIIEAEGKSIIAEQESIENNKKKRLISDIIHSKPKNYFKSQTSVIYK